MEPPATEAPAAGALTEREVLDRFRHWGYLQADLDPLGRLPPQPHAELDELEGEAADRARRSYCGPIGVEFMHIPDPERRRWVAERMEAPAEVRLDRRRVLERLVRAETFEQVIQSRYLGSKRFSLEGITALIPLLDEAVAAVAERGGRQLVLAMSHRGRLNVMAHVAGLPLAHLLAGFEDVDPRSVLGAGDVKYHLGATGYHPHDREERVRIHLVSNPSHLEAVHAVALGRTRAKQLRFGEAARHKVVPVVLHGDAAFAGQGITAEALNMSGLPGFEVGGAVHVVVNNLIGFTTDPVSLHPSRFATDVARRLPAPIVHVNGEQIEAVIRAARLALDFRFTFGSDVVVDLIGYRRHGHSEVDDPTITQPKLYARIAEHPPLWRRWGEEIGVPAEVTDGMVAGVREEMSAAQQEASQLERIPTLRDLPSYWADYTGGRYEPSYEVTTGLADDRIAALAERLASVPDGFHLHPKIAKLLEQRRAMGRGERPIDFGMAEALAFGSLVEAGVPVRLSGQDSARGTFNQRHAVLTDVETEEDYCPLAHLAAGQAPLEIYNSMLSEAAVLGFEYGYSRDCPEGLVAWEAQFGDFVNGAQVILDQFVAAAEDKWGLLSGLTVLLPHGYEGQGPEHSSARVERFLQLAAEDNIQVAQPATAAQYFHLLRRQALRRWRKPLVVFTPKSMLRHPAAASPRASFGRERFLPLLPDRGAEDPRRLLLCSGKIRHELRQERDQRRAADTAIASLDQLYPFPKAELAAEIKRFPGLEEIVWVQEEPANMGPRFFAQPRIEEIARRGLPVRSVNRSPSASPATGSAKAHQLEQKTLLALAFTTRG